MSKEYSKKKLLIMTVCKKERHQSVAAKELLNQSLQNIFPDVEIVDLILTSFGRHMCVNQGQCEFCS